MAQGLDDHGGLSGPEKAAIFMVAVGEAHCARLFAMMNDNEVRELSRTMTNLGPIGAPTVERLFAEFANQLSSTASLMVSMEPKERL